MSCGGAVQELKRILLGDHRLGGSHGRKGVRPPHRAVAPGDTERRGDTSGSVSPRTVSLVQNRPIQNEG